MMPLDWDNLHLVVFDVDGTLTATPVAALDGAGPAVLHASETGPERTCGARQMSRIRERLGDELAID